MTDIPYLTRRGSTFYFRLRVPCDLIPVFGRRELLRSLRTREETQATHMVQAIANQAETTFATLRHQILLGLDTDSLTTTARSFLETNLPCHRVTRSPATRLTALMIPQAHQDSQKISEVAQTYIQDRKGRWEAKTRMMQEAALRLFQEIIGDKAVAGVSRDDGRTFRDTVAKLPPNMGKRFTGMSIEAVLALKPEPMSLKNTNKILSAVSAFFNWAVEEKLIPENPVKGLKLASSKRADQEREAFSNSDLMALFKLSPLYQGCLSERQRDQSGGRIIKDAKYWLPLIGLYSGMRLEEIAQLQVQDLREVDGIWVFDVNGKGDKKVKTQQSERLVPVHSKLIEMGLIQYCNQVKGSQLWPELKRGNDGFYSSPFSKWFGRYKKKVGIDNPKVTFHSLRHTFINALKQHGVEEAKIKELVGHKETSITMGRYGKRYEPRALSTTIELLTFAVETPVRFEHPQKTIIALPGRPAAPEN